MSRDVIGDFLTIIRNGIAVGKPYVVAPYSNLKEDLSNILKEEGFIKDIVIEGEGINKNIKVLLRYLDGESAIHKIVRVSRPSRRVYAGSQEVKPVIGGLGVAILSTSKGLMTNKKAKDLVVGGEIICTVW